MSELSNKAKGAVNQLMGEAKIAVGKGAKDSSTVAKGQMQKAKGKAQGMLGEVEGELGDKT